VVEDLEFAALMHDIGRITLTDPAIVQAGYTDADIAKWGAEIIAQAPYLDRVAEHVRRLNDPFRQPGEQVDPTMSMISKIIRAASAYDHAIQEQGFTSLQAVEELHRGAAYDYDPEVVASLRKVLERRGAFHPAARHQ
jgi:HD-GYP domain-containing protein (c-di-GMP phosphodiesterase class II)